MINRKGPKMVRRVMGISEALLPVKIISAGCNYNIPKWSSGYYCLFYTHFLSGINIYFGQQTFPFIRRSACRLYTQWQMHIAQLIILYFFFQYFVVLVISFKCVIYFQFICHVAHIILWQPTRLSKCSAKHPKNKLSSAEATSRNSWDNT